MADPIPCPFVYSTGKRCTGHVAKVEAYKADLEWSFDTSNGWTFRAGEPRSHYHVFCSEKGNHAGVMREDALKLYYSQLARRAQAGDQSDLTGTTTTYSANSRRASGSPLPFSVAEAYRPGMGRASRHPVASCPKRS